MRRWVGVIHPARLKLRDLDGFTRSDNMYPPNLRVASRRTMRRGDSWGDEFVAVPSPHGRFSGQDGKLSPRGFRPESGGSFP
jgi:hypothetical protein